MKVMCIIYSKISVGWTKKHWCVAEYCCLTHSTTKVCLLYVLHHIKGTCWAEAMPIKQWTIKHVIAAFSYAGLKQLINQWVENLTTFEIVTYLILKGGSIFGNRFPNFFFQAQWTCSLQRFLKTTHSDSIESGSNFSKKSLMLVL